MVQPGRDPISGTVEVDDCYVGAKKSGKHGRGAVIKTLVVIIVEVEGKKFGRIRFQQVIDTSSKSLEDVIKRAVELGSIVWTDGWNGYNGLDSLGYIHEVVCEQSAIGNSLFYPIAIR